MERVQQLSEKVTKILLHEIRHGKFAGMDALPPEVELAGKFNVSRNIIRECLTRLERGFQTLDFYRSLGGGTKEI